MILPLKLNLQIQLQNLPRPVRRAATDTKVSERSTNPFQAAIKKLSLGNVSERKNFAPGAQVSNLEDLEYIL